MWWKQWQRLQGEILRTSIFRSDIFLTALSWLEKSAYCRIGNVFFTPPWWGWGLLGKLQASGKRQYLNMVLPVVFYSSCRPESSKLRPGIASSEARPGSRIEEAGCKSHGQSDIRVRDCLSSAVTTILGLSSFREASVKTTNLIILISEVLWWYSC